MANDDETLESYGSDIGQRTTSLTRAKEWVMVEANRLSIAVALCVIVFASLLVLARFEFIAFLDEDAITRLASGMIAGTFSLVTIVVSINQLILSREFRSADEMRNRLGGVMEFREDIEEKTNVPTSPAEPTRLLHLLVQDIRHRAEEVSRAVEDHPDSDFRETVDRYTNSVIESTDRIDETLEESEFGTFNAVSAAIGYNDAWQVYAARHLRNSHADSLSEEADEAFGDLIDSLQLFNVAREHFKTTYMQRELTRLSQLVLYTGVPAVLAGILLGLVYSHFDGSAIAVGLLPYLTSALITVVFLPLALLAAFILRSATLVRRTASIGPMLPQKRMDEGPFEVSYED